MRKLFVLLAAVLCLTVGAAAYEVPTDFTDRTVEDVVTEFREAHGLNEKNFSICYYNTVTGEEYTWNDTRFFLGASTYKLPLNMYFYEMEQAGEITADTVISWTGQTLAEIHRQSIVYSNNELSEALSFYWGDHCIFKENLRKYFSMAEEDIDPIYWQANWFCTDMMMDCLKYLWENQDLFEELIGYMKQAMPGQYFKRGVTEYEVAHKYGSVQYYNNDVGIIYTEQPFLLVVYTGMEGIGNDGICAEAAQLMTAYNVWKAANTPVEEMPEEVPEEPAAESPVAEEPVPEEPVPEEPPVKESPVPTVNPSEPEPPAKQISAFPLVLAVIAAAVLLLALLCRLKRK